MSQPHPNEHSSACPTCGESWTQPRTNTYGPPMPGLECPDDWHFANWREDDDDDDR